MSKWVGEEVWENLCIRKRICSRLFAVVEAAEMVGTIVAKENSEMAIELLSVVIKTLL